MKSAFVGARPDPRDWAALPTGPSRKRQLVVACLSVAMTTVVTFVADRAWETFDDDAWEGPYRAIDMLGLSGLLMAVLFSVGGWFLGRLAVGAAPFVLAYAAFPHTVEGYASAPYWWAGAAVAALWALLQVSAAVREIQAIRVLAISSDTGLNADIGRHARAALRKPLRLRLLWAAALSAAAVIGYVATKEVLATELGYSYQQLEGESISDCLATATAGLSIGALIQWMRCAWTATARHTVGTILWQVPPGVGPVYSTSVLYEEADRVLPFERARALSSCSCLAEQREEDPDEDEEYFRSYGVLVSNYCPEHGIDKINSLTPEEFRALATNTWLFDEDSPVPASDRNEADRDLVIGFAGHSFTGFPGHFRDGVADVDPAWVEPLEEREPGDNDYDVEHRTAPSAGVLDRIDLHLASIAGHAIRYRHGRAWFEPSEQSRIAP